MENDKRSLVYFLIAMFIYGTIGIFRRLIPLSSAVIVCFRGFCGALFILVFCLIKKEKFVEKLPAKTMLLLILCGCLLGLNWMVLFEAYNYTTVSTATMCYNMGPMYLILLSPLLFHEKIGLKKGLCVLAALIGVILISGVIETGFPGLSEMKGILLGLLSGVLYASVIILNKFLSGINAYFKTITELFFAGLCMIPYILMVGSLDLSGMDLRATIMLLMIGFIHTGVAYVLYFGSMDGLKASTIGIFSYLDPIVALILSALILGETMSIYGWIGSVLIIGGAVISEINFKKVK